VSILMVRPCVCKRARVRYAATGAGRPSGLRQVVKDELQQERHD
jgi:hypothetical protein